jgi:ABC-type metal ion transport system, periplasmic component/surface antigen
MKKISKIIFVSAALTVFAASLWAAPKKGRETTVTLGVTGTVYEDLWAPAKKILKGQGINLKLVQFSDYVTPNNALANGEIDLNAFQHRIFFEGELKRDTRLQTSEILFFLL